MAKPPTKLSLEDFKDVFAGINKEISKAQSRSDSKEFNTKSKSNHFNTLKRNIDSHNVMISNRINGKSMNKSDVVVNADCNNKITLIRKEGKKVCDPEKNKMKSEMLNKLIMEKKKVNTGANEANVNTQNKCNENLKDCNMKVGLHEMNMQKEDNLDKYYSHFIYQYKHNS